jgi:hypothetical protein
MPDVGFVVPWTLLFTHILNIVLRLVLLVCYTGHVLDSVFESFD